MKQVLSNNNFCQNSQMCTSMTIKFISKLSIKLRRAYPIYSLNAQLSTVECHYNTVLYNMILYMVRQRLKQNINQRLNSQKEPHIRPSQESFFSEPIGRTLKKIDCMIMTLHYAGITLGLLSLYDWVSSQPLVYVMPYLTGWNFTQL